MVEVLVNNEVAQAPGGNHGNALIAGPALDGLAQCLPEGIAALGSRLIGGVVGVQHNGHGRHGRPIHDTPINKAEGMSHTLVRGFGGCATTHVEGTGTTSAFLAILVGETVGCRDRPRIGAACPLVRLVSGGGDHITGDRPRPDPVWETAYYSVPPAPTAVLRLFPATGGCHDTPQRLCPCA